MVKTITQNGNWKWISVIVTILLAAAGIIYAAGGLGGDIQSNTNETARVNEDGCKPSRIIKNEQAKMSVTIDGITKTNDTQDGDIFHLEEVAHDTERVLTILQTESKQTQKDMAEVKADMKEVLRAVKGN